MLPLFWHVRWLLLQFIVGQLHVHYVITAWPPSNFSNIQLLGLFQDAENASNPSELSVHSRAMFQAAILLSQKYNITVEGQYISWQSSQTGGNAIDALRDICLAVSTSNIAGIVGPSFSREAHSVAEFAQRIGIPTVSYGATDPDLSDRSAYPTFYRTVPSDNVAASAIVDLFIRYNWTSCIIIYQNDAFGTGGVKAISDAFEEKKLIVRETVMFDINGMRIRGDLKNILVKTASRIVVLWVDSDYSPLILQSALDVDVIGPKFTWILSSSFSLDSFNETYYEKLIGILTVEPTIGTAVNKQVNTTLLNAAYDIWRQYEPDTFPNSTQVNYYAFFAFDATWLLIQALQQLCSTTIGNSSSCVSFSGPSFCFDRYFINSELFLNAVSSTQFLGVSGLVKFNDNITDRINGSYYVAQNIQPSGSGLSFAPVLDYSVSDGWNKYIGSTYIIWPGQTLLNVPTDRPQLDGVTLRICIVLSVPFTSATNVTNATGYSEKYVGYVPALIDALKEKMGFIANTSLAPAGKTYAELIQGVADDVYDIMVGDVTVTSSRRLIVGFSNAIFENSLRIIMRTTPDVTVDLLSFLKPFSLNLWLVILGTCIYAGLLLCFIERKNNEALQERSIVSQIAMSLWYSFGNIVGYGVDFDASSAAGRVLTAGLYVLSLILVASYTANLASDLTISKSKGVISGIEDIKSGKIPFNRIGIRKGTAMEEYFLREISGGSQNYYVLHSRQETYDSLLANIIDASFIDSGVGEYITKNVYCNLTLVGDGFDAGFFGIVTPKDWLYAQDLDVNILSLRESGTLDTLKKTWFDIQNCPDTAETTTAMAIESMAGLFLVFGVISILALLLFIWVQRYTIKHHFFRLIGRKSRSNKRDDSITKDSIKGEDYILKDPIKIEDSITKDSIKPIGPLENRQVTSSDFLYF